MLFSEIKPFVRYARYINLTTKSSFYEVVPLDARLFYTLRGNGKIKIQNTEYEMSAGSLLIVNSGVPYHILMPENTVSYIAINFDYTQKAASRTMPIKPVSRNKFSKEMLVDFNSFDDVEVLSEVLYIKNIDYIQKKLTYIVREYMQKMLYYEHKSSHLLADCITDSVRFLAIGNTTHAKEQQNQILTYIHDNYQKNLTNHSIGQIFGYHPNYVSFLIKHITGMPLHQYLIHVRLLNAVNLLENTTMPICEIALACGFCDTAYFSGYFKKHFGMSPTKYRCV